MKAYAACASAHTTIDGVRQLRARGLNAANLARLEVRTSKKTHINIAWAYEPGEAITAQMNGRYAAAVTLIEYDRAHLEERAVTDKEELLPHLDNQRVTWINIDGLGDIDVLRRLGSRFNLHPLALEDVLATGQRPKVEQYDGYLFIIVQMLYLNDAKQMCGEQVSIFLGKNFLITLQEEADFDVFEPVRVRIRNPNGAIRKLGADYLAYALLDSIVDHYYPVLESLGAAIDAIEDQLAETPLRSPVGELHQHKRTSLRSGASSGPCATWLALSCTTRLAWSRRGPRFTCAIATIIPCS
jgi:Mg2+ and Co2+ transporter CorA